MKEERTPQQILQESQEEFQKKFESFETNFGDKSKEAIIKGQVMEVRFIGKQKMQKELLSWHISTLKAFIEAEIAHLDKMKDGYNCRECGSEGYDKAIDDQISHLKLLTKR